MALLAMFAAIIFIVGGSYTHNEMTFLTGWVIACFAALTRIGDILERVSRKGDTR